MTTLVDEKLKQFRAQQGDIQTLFGKKQMSLSQFNENTLVKGELDLLDESAEVFKLVGPVLIRVELDEAKVNVSKRLEFIEGEMKKTDNQIAAKQGEQTALGDEIAALQKQMQAEAAKAAREAAAAAMAAV